jgi:hypothetical protein
MRGTSHADTFKRKQARQRTQSIAQVELIAAAFADLPRARPHVYPCICAQERPVSSPLSCAQEGPVSSLPRALILCPRPTRVSIQRVHRVFGQTI